MTLSSSSTDDAHTLSPRGRDSSSRSRAGRHVLNEWRKRKRGPRTCCVLIFFFLSIHLPIDKPRPWRLRNNPTSLSFSLFISFLRFFASSCGEVTFCISFSSFMEARKRETHGRSIWCFPKVHSGLSVYYVCIYTPVVVAFLRRRLGPFGGRQQQTAGGNWWFFYATTPPPPPLTRFWLYFHLFFSSICYLVQHVRHASR